MPRLLAEIRILAEGRNSASYSGLLFVWSAAWARTLQPVWRSALP